MAKTESSTQPLRAAAVVAGITAAAAVVAAAARGPLSRSTPIDASSASAPVTALSSLLLGAGIVALTALAILIFRQRRRKDDPEDQSEPPEIHWIWKIVAILTPFALGAALILAAITGAKKLPVARNLSGGLGGGLGVTSGRAAPPTGGRTGYVLPAWLPWTILAIVLVAILAGVAALVLRRGRAPTGAPEPAAAGEAVQAAIAALEAGADPRGAVIAAYAAMQRTLAAHGLVHLPSEAPREFLRRVLVANRAAEEDAGTLTGLFEEARFSTHPISERTRDRALSALRSLELRPEMAGAK